MLEIQDMNEVLNSGEVVESYYNPDALEINIIEFEFTALLDGSGAWYTMRRKHDTRNPGGRPRMFIIEAIKFPGDLDLNSIMEHFESEGWAVRSWPGGCRMWKGGEVWPIRTKGQILRLRRLREEKASRDSFAGYDDKVSPDGLKASASAGNLALDF